MRAPYQSLIAALCIALQAMDLAVGLMGHRHDDAGVALATGESHKNDHHAGCGHHHHAKPADRHEHESEGQHSHPRSHDDCSLCRHFSQPVNLAAIAIEICGSQAVVQLVSPAPQQVCAISRRVHDARGPPALCA